MEFYLDGVLVYPDNANNFKVSLEADPLNNRQVISESFLEFSKTRDSAGFDKINEWIALKNYAVGLPAEIKEKGQTYFTGWANLASVENQFTCDFFSVQLVEKPVNTKEILNELSFQYLEYIGIIQKSDFLPLQISLENIPDANAAVLQALTIYQTTKELNEAAKDVANPLQAVYLGVQVPTLVTLWKNFIENTFPFLRFWYGMKVRTMFEKIAQYMGLTFESSVLDRNYTILPPKDKKPVTNLDNALDKGYELISTGEFISRMEKFFYSRLTIQGDVMRFERVDYYYSQDSGVELPDLLPEQSIYRTNLQELSQFRVLKYQRDPNENHTNNSTFGYICQSYTEIPNADAQSMLLKDAEEILLDYTRGHRKSELSEIEVALATILNPLFSLIEGLASAAGLNVDLPEFPERIGALKVSDERTSVAKMLICEDDGTVSIVNEQELRASVLYDKFHSVGSMVNNQWLIYDSLTFPINDFNDVIALKNSNYARDAAGNIALIEENERDEDCFHTITYRVKKNYLPENIQEIITEE